ncbi:hypothetical protein Bca4012_090744 [Brassica carinata]|uniref:Uncharacterized protein n=1 Tax=Brassica carinata TaxID=52824 RepID=A0A8X7P5B2_BRACI|nr:hypothetical protein Bca52824_085902 [Brassica carinata]
MEREISSTLRNLKVFVYLYIVGLMNFILVAGAVCFLFMQRSALKEEKKKKIDEEPNASFSSLASVVAKNLDATSALKTPITLLGRMSFQSFNPSIELSVIELFFLLKLNEEAISGRETDALPQTLALMEEDEPKIEPSRKTNGDLKRKHAEGVSEEQNHPSNSPRSSDTPLPSNKKGRNGFKKTKSRKEAWSVLKPPKPQTNKVQISSTFFFDIKLALPICFYFICDSRSFLPLVCIRLIS